MKQGEWKGMGFSFVLRYSSVLASFFEKNRIKSLIFLSVLFFVFGNLSFARDYPVKEVSGKFCGNNQICTIPLPKIEQANYLNYEKSPLIRRIYSVLWGGTYFWGRDFGWGAHKGVDITSQIGTPIYAIGTGEVIYAGKKWERGKLITIEHSFAGKKIYSNYAHLSQVLVKVGDKVKTSDLIAKMGTSGNSTGPHLHFQIDKTEWKHPYHPGNCGGVTLNQNVNEARCWNLVRENTLDPILFLESDGAIFEVEQESEQFSPDIKVLSTQDLKKNLETSFEKKGDFWLLTLKSLTPWWTRVPLKITSAGAKIYPDSLSYLSWERKIFVQEFSGTVFPISIWEGEKLIKNVYEK